VAKTGKAQGVRKALAVLLEKQFGSVPDWAQQKIETASERRALAWLVKAGGVAELTDLIPRR
jgi:hypothetical protein